MEKKTPVNDAVKMVEKDLTDVMTTLSNDAIGLFKDAEKAVMEIPNGKRNFKE